MQEKKNNAVTAAEFRGRILEWTEGADDKFNRIIKKLDNHNKSIGNNITEIEKVKTEIDVTKSNFKLFVGIILGIFTATIALLKFIF